jgi:hypothetical protein
MKPKAGEYFILRSTKNTSTNFTHFSKIYYNSSQQDPKLTDAFASKVRVLAMLLWTV